MKKIYYLILALLLSGEIAAQCTVFATQYIWPDTNNIASCYQLGDTLVIDASSTQVNTPLDNSFEIGLGTGWIGGASTNVILNDPTHCAWPPPVPVPPIVVNSAYV